ncbi:hypothetical protein [Paraclostridium dentum]|uniref:hypothetical protein n=1 Tax=Paraclostridium dentum TaxID=2662455 RepID=UPI003F4067D1
MIIVNGNDIRTANYVPYSNPGDGSMNINISNGYANTMGLGYMESVDGFGTFTPASGQVTDVQAINPDGEVVQEITTNASYDADGIIRGMLQSINNGIRGAAAEVSTYRPGNSSYTYGSNLPNREESTYVYTNLVNKRNVFNSQYYSDNYDPRMIDKNMANNYMKDVGHSIKQLSGIYNFLGGMAFGEQSYTFEYENAGAMTSFSRHF